VELERSLAITKALADGSRLRVLACLLEGGRYVEELSERLGLAASTVSFHLGKLQQVGLVAKERQQYYTVYRVRPELLDLRLRDLLDTGASERSLQQERTLRYERKVLDAFFDGPCLRRMPAQRKKAAICLRRFAADMEPGRRYPELELNSLIRSRYADYCTVRRRMIEEGMVARHRQVYWLVAPVAPPGGTVGSQEGRTAGTSSPAPGPGVAIPRARPATADVPPTTQQDAPMDKQTRKQLKQAYKLRAPEAGLYGVRNRATGRVLVGSTLNLQGALNRQRFTLETGSHPCVALQQEWERLGPDAFVLEVLETVRPEPGPNPDVDGALAALEQAWIERLSPPSERCYNTNPKIRTQVY